MISIAENKSVPTDILNLNMVLSCAHVLPVMVVDIMIIQLMGELQNALPVMAPGKNDTKMKVY